MLVGKLFALTCSFSWVNVAAHSLCVEGGPAAESGPNLLLNGLVSLGCEVSFALLSVLIIHDSLIVGQSTRSYALRNSWSFALAWHVQVFDIFRVVSYPLILVLFDHIVTEFLLFRVPLLPFDLIVQLRLETTDFIRQRNARWQVRFSLLDVQVEV